VDDVAHGTDPDDQDARLGLLLAVVNTLCEFPIAALVGGFFGEDCLRLDRLGEARSNGAREYDVVYHAQRGDQLGASLRGSTGLGGSWRATKSVRREARFRPDAGRAPPGADRRTRRPGPPGFPPGRQERAAAAACLQG